MYNIIEVVSRKWFQLTPDVTLDSRIRIWERVTDFSPIIPLTILFNVQAKFHLFQFSFPWNSLCIWQLLPKCSFCFEFFKFNNNYYSQTNGNRSCETNYSVIHVLSNQIFEKLMHSMCHSVNHACMIHYPNLHF